LGRFSIKEFGFEDLDKKRLKLEVVIAGFAVVIALTGMIMSVIKLSECLKIRTPHFLTDISDRSIEPGDYVKIDFDCSYDTLKYEGIKTYTLRLAGKEEYVYAEDPDPAQGYWYFRDYGFFDNPMQSVGYTPDQPFTVIAAAVGDERKLGNLKYYLSEFNGVTSYNVPNTEENTYFEYYFERINVKKVREAAYMWLFAAAVGIAGVVIAVKWAIRDQEFHINIKRFERDNEKARQALQDFYIDRRKNSEKRRRKL